MAWENNKISIVDGSGVWLQVSVVPLLSDPTKFGIVVLNPDWSSISPDLSNYYTKTETNDLLDTKSR